ncbi:MAG: hypothetical protein CLLPBCKN_006416 [Chroococcidiopsis cubana SAG 39.79]|uniref:hypothetical protein n=1 Tax=Chroococcidiopsis cubana TaxID=171392 RepID=UPI0013159196|nr:hypothetical protein [Chroococcidiopsis cubana]MDZ4876981.1 hypothetical protein [Chroococcidiopsis cubana SAG 39.79]
MNFDSSFLARHSSSYPYWLQNLGNLGIFVLSSFKESERTSYCTVYNFSTRT